MTQHYLNITRILIESLPFVFESTCFALKGGTAINFFIQDMPRLSVDIDATFVDRAMPRMDALQKTNDELYLVRERLIQEKIGTVKVDTSGTEHVAKLYIERSDALVKVEVNPVFRGTMFPIEHHPLTDAALRKFKIPANIPTLAVPEIYGGKLVDAMSRQHPRDLFDVNYMLDSHGLAPDIVECFISYLLGDKKPLHNVLFSNDLDVATPYKNEFSGMTFPHSHINLEDLLETRDRLRAELYAKITPAQKQFLLGFVAGKPDWSLMKCPHLSEMPAVK